MGENSVYGQLGDGTSTNRSTPVLMLSSASIMITQPANQSVIASQSATFSVAATDTTAPVYQWYQWQSSTNGSTWTNIYKDYNFPGAATATLTVNTVTLAMNGTQYRCIVTNAAGSVTTDPATLTVNATPVFTKQPANQIAAANQTATFTIVATGGPTPAYQWQSSPDGIAWTNILGITATTATLTLDAVTVGMNGTLYRCVATNSQGFATSNPASLTVTPAIISQPASQSTIARQTVTFTTEAIGYSALTYQWQSFTNGTTWTNISGATNATLALDAVTLGINGIQYRCVITNYQGTITSDPATLTVYAAPVFTTQPASQLALINQNVTFSITVTGNPTPTYQWQSSSDGRAWTNISGATSTTLTLNAVTTAISGTQYRCVATNEQGTSTSNAATLAVYSAPLAPIVSTQPADQPASIGQNITFTISVIGYPMPTLQWQSSSNGTTWTNISGATAATLTLTSVTAAMNVTQYRCVVTNSVSTATSNVVTLTVTSTAPVFTTQPVGQTTTAGHTATFTIAATGNPTPTCQWQTSSNGSTWANISGATAITLTLNAVTTAMNGTQYRCVATNSQGTATSNPATLTVNPITQPPPPDTPQLDVDKITLALAQPATATANFAITSNITWTTQIKPATATWLAVNPPTGNGNFPNATATTITSNTTGAPRTASIIVNGGDITRTLIATQAATNVAPNPAPAALPVGATLTLTADTAPSGKVFDKWTSNAGGSFANSNNATTTFTMPATATTVTATYKDQTTGGNNNGGNSGGGGGGGGAPSLLWLGAITTLLALRAKRRG